MSRLRHVAVPNREVQSFLALLNRKDIRRVSLGIALVTILVAIPTATRVYGSAPTSKSPVYRTDFETVTKNSANTVNMGIQNWFEFQGSGGATMWMEGLDRTSGITCHTGTRCVGMELTDISKSRRAEFNIMNLQNLGINKEYFVSVWLYLPSDWRMHSYNQWGLNWWELVVPAGQGGPTYTPGVAMQVGQKDITVDKFLLRFYTHNVPGSPAEWTTYKEIDNYPIPRGRWFNIQYYVLRDPTNGIVRVWIDGNLLWNQAGIPTSSLTENPKVQLAKVYYDTSDTYSPYRIWVDDLEIYNAQPLFPYRVYGA